MAPRWWLQVQALFWRSLACIGMFLHRIAFPYPPSPSFVRSIFIPLEEDQSNHRKLILHFYCPPDYLNRVEDGVKFPVVVNFHGGGFTVGNATDDCRWAQCVLQEVDSVMVSIEYRRAPEYPFPAAVDDGVEALLYLSAHSVELGLDVSRIALSGFSAGGNLAVTVPLRLRSRLPNSVTVTGVRSPAGFLSRADSSQTLVNDMTNDLRIVALFCWYPILDFEESREYRRAHSVKPHKTLPAALTTLFDESYLPDHSARISPYASPVRASDDLLLNGLPHHVYLYICEWDMLLREGQCFVRRLQALGKRVRAMMIERVTHAWDKSPNPFRNQEPVTILYRDACADMNAIFSKQPGALV